MDATLSASSSARLRLSLKAIYRLFEAAPPLSIEGCPCCIETRGADVLLTTPLRELSGQELWRYTTGAFLTVGGREDFRYLLPRILDISANDPGNAPNAEIVLGKFWLAELRSWPLHERQAVQEFIEAWFVRELERDLATAEDGWVMMDAESILCGAARAGLSLSRLLMRLLAPDAAPVLTELKVRFPNELSPFWEETPAGLRELSTILEQGHA